MGIVARPATARVREHTRYDNGKPRQSSVRGKIMRGEASRDHHEARHEASPHGNHPRVDGRRGFPWF
jgi:hypothetical protein